MTGDAGEGGKARAQAAGDARGSSSSPTAPKKRIGGGGLAVVAVIAVVFGVSQCGGGSSGLSASSGEDTQIAPSTVTVTYELTGSATQADITYETPSGSSQQSAIDVPMKSESGEPMSFDFDPGAFVYFSAQIVNDDGGDVTCKIVGSDGTVISSNTASGFPSIVTCKGSAS